MREFGKANTIFVGIPQGRRLIGKPRNVGLRKEGVSMWGCGLD
jgi:hypothetical protein